MAAKKDSSTDAGVSESIGFILIFSMVIAGIGLVTLYGYPMLLQQQVNTNERIMEKNMIVLQNDVKSLAYKTVPFKETSLKVEGGALTVYNTQYSPAVSKIDIKDCGGGNVYVSGFQSGDLRYSSTSAGTDISLQNGAVVKRQVAQTGSVMLAEPRWFYDAPTNTMVINLIGFNSTDLMSLAGIGTVQMVLGETNYQYVSPVPGSLCVVYNTPDPTPLPDKQDYSIAWDNYFMKTLNNPPAISVSRTGTPGTGGQLTYTITQTGSTPMTLVIKKYEVIIISL
jgi:hypothetical protein